MSDPSGNWTANPNTPSIPYGFYILEKSNFASDSVSAALYGIAVALFFQCMIALLNPTNRTKHGTKWGLMVHTATMFSIVTLTTGMGLNSHSRSYIDNRGFPGNEEIPPGPLGYKILSASKATSVVPNVTPLVNQWLADGFLLYRCYIIYGMNYWVVAFPCLMYLATVVIGLTYIAWDIKFHGAADAFNLFLGYPYFSISLALNIILTLMIVTRLVLHNRNIRNATGNPAGVSGLYSTIVTMLIESCALYTCAILLYVIPWWANSDVSTTFGSILTETQVIAPLLIVLRVANRRALTSEAIVSGNIGSIRFRSQGESADDSGTVAYEYPTGSVGTDGGNPSGLPDGSEDTIGKAIDEVPL